MVRFILIISIFLSSIFLALTSTAQPTPVLAQDSAPFLYYFSSQHHAFVVERADGTDSWLLGKDVMPTDHTNVFDMGWSASGEWFAWWSSDSWRAHGGQLWIISADGETVLNLPSEFDYIANIAWSPYNDYLVIEYSLYIDDALNNALLIYDVEQNEIIWSREWGPLEIEIYGVDDFSWFQDGQSFVLMQDCNCANNLTVLDMITLQERHFTVQSFSSHETFILSSTNTIFVRDADQNLLAIDLISFDQTNLGEFDHDIEFFEWSLDGEQVLIMFNSIERDGYYLWILNAERIIPVEQKIIVPFEYPVDLTDMWLPDNQTVLIHGADHYLYWVDSVDGSIEHVDEIPQLTSEYTPYALSIWTDEYGYIQTSNAFWIYELATQSFSQIPDKTYPFGTFAPLHDTHSLIGFNNCYTRAYNPCLSILDLTTFETVELYPDPNIWYRYWINYGEFYLRDNWILFSVDELVTNHHFYWSVVQDNGTNYRPIESCSPINSNCVQWLPMNVDTQHIPQTEDSVVYQPQTLVGHPSEVRGVDWSHDGESIASVSETEIRIWDVATGETSKILPHTDANFAVLDIPIEIQWSPHDKYIGVVLGQAPENPLDAYGVRIWDVENETLIAEYPEATSFEFIDETTLWLAFPTGFLVEVDLATNTQKEIINSTTPLYPGMRYLTISADQEHFAFLADNAKTLIVWHSWYGLEEDADYLQFATSADFTQVFYIWGGNIYGADLELRKYTRLERWGPLALSPDERYLLIGLNIWDAQTLTPLYSNYGNALATAWSPDGRYFVSVNAHSVRIWEVDALLNTLPD